MTFLLLSNVKNIYFEKISNYSHLLNIKYIYIYLKKSIIYSYFEEVASTFFNLKSLLLNFVNF